MIYCTIGSTNRVELGTVFVEPIVYDVQFLAENKVSNDMALQQIRIKLGIKERAVMFFQY